MYWGKNLSAIAIILALTLLTNSVMAFDFEASNEKISVGIGDTQAIDFILNSNIDDFIIFSVDGMPSWATLPTNVPILAGQLTKTSIYFSPYETTKPLTYKMTAKLQSSKTGQIKERNITVVVRTSNVAIEKLQLDGSFKPADKGLLQLFVKNYENRKLDLNLDYSVVGSDGSIVLYKNEKLLLEPKELNIIKQDFPIPECIKTGSYTVLANITEAGIRLASFEQSFKTESEFKTLVDRRENQNFLRTDVIVTIKNIGNIPGTSSISERIWGSMFFSGDNPSEIGSEYTWSLPLAVCETKSIKYSIDYTIVAEVLFVVLIVLYIFFKFRPLRLSKYIIQKQTIEKGSVFTVGIEFKSHSSVKDVEIRDFVPGVFRVIESGKALKHSTDMGTELIWKFPELKPGEERIVSYKIMPSFSVTGSVKLPRAVISFKHFGKIIEKRTWPVFIGMDFGDVDFSLKHARKHISRVHEKIKNIRRKI